VLLSPFREEDIASRPLEAWQANAYRERVVIAVAVKCMGRFLWI
jgi:hypothetical protein